MLGGGFDYLVKLRTRDMQDYRHFLGHVLGALDMVETTHTYFVMEEVKESTCCRSHRRRIDGNFHLRCAANTETTLKG